MVGTVVGLAGLYLFLKIVVPLLILAAVVYFAMQWTRGNSYSNGTFSASEPDENDRRHDDIQ